MTGAASAGVLFGVGLLLLAAGTAGPRYGDTLLAEAARHVDGALRIEAHGKDGVAIVVGPAVVGGVVVPLSDAMGNAIGTLTAAGPATDPVAPH